MPVTTFGDDSESCQLASEYVWFCPLPELDVPTLPPPLPLRAEIWGPRPVDCADEEEPIDDLVD